MPNVIDSARDARRLLANYAAIWGSSEREILQIAKLVVLASVVTSVTLYEQTLTVVVSFLYVMILCILARAQDGLIERMFVERG